MRRYAPNFAKVRVVGYNSEVSNWLKNPLNQLKEQDTELPPLLKHKNSKVLAKYTFNELVKCVSESLASRQEQTKYVKNKREKVVATLKKYAFKNLTVTDEKERAVVLQALGWDDESLDRFVKAKYAFNMSPHTSLNTAPSAVLRYQFLANLTNTHSDAMLVHTTLTYNSVGDAGNKPSALHVTNRDLQLLNNLKQLGNKLCYFVSVDSVSEGAKQALRQLLRASKANKYLHQLLNSEGQDILNKVYLQPDLAYSKLPTNVAKSSLDNGSPEVSSFEQMSNFAYAAVLFKARVLKKMYKLKGNFVELPLDVVVKAFADELSDVNFLEKFEESLKQTHLSLLHRGFYESGLEKWVNYLDATAKTRPGVPALFRYVKSGEFVDLVKDNNKLYELEDVYDKGLQYTQETLKQGLEQGYLAPTAPLLIYAMQELGLDFLVGGRDMMGFYPQVKLALENVGKNYDSSFLAFGSVKAPDLPVLTLEDYLPESLKHNREKVGQHANLLNLSLSLAGKQVLERSMEAQYGAL